MSAFDGPAAVEMMMHACGHMRHQGRLVREPYRNHYCASTENEAAWDVLVAMGLATCREVDWSGAVAQGGCTTRRIYFVTRAGIALLWERCKAERAAARAQT